MMILYLCFYVCLLAVLVSGDGQKADPEIVAPAGTFRGKVLTAPGGGEYAAYRGIPYALPPTGERRFALPKPHPKIEDDVFDASDFGPVCFQHVHGISLGQEDCLFLNVYTPLNVKEPGGKLKNVLVFIHGGGFILGSSNEYVPGDLVSKGDVVVATFNHRLGWFGFLRGDSKRLPGNQAFHDQVLALKWVKDNIRAFGGDPEHVTLSGESAGAISVSVLTVSPLAKGLFNKAILMSGAAFSYPCPAQSSTDLLELIASQTGCDKEVDHISCLQRKPTESFQMEFTMALLILLPTSGDEMTPHPFPELVRDPEYLNEVGFFNRDYIVSVTKHDGYIRVNSILGKIDTTSVEASSLDISRLLQLPEKVAQALVLQYMKSFEDVEEAVIALNTEIFYLQRSNYFLEAFDRQPPQAKKSQENHAYFMSFDHPPTFFPNQYTVHAMDVVILFDIPVKEFTESAYFVEVQGGLSKKDEEMKESLIDLFTNFMDGNPSDRQMKDRNIVWPPFDSDTRHYLSFSLQPEVHRDLYGDRRIIWERLVPQWKREYVESQERQEL